MQLNLVTISAADIAVAAVLAGMLLLTWGRDGWSLEAAPRFVGAWGVSILVFSLGSAVMLASAVAFSTDGIALGAGLNILASALKWNAARRFAGKASAPFWIVFGPTCFLIIAYSGLAPSLDGRFVAACSFLAFYGFAAGLELRRMPDTTQSWPAIALLFLGGASYLSWIPIAFTLPLGSVSAALTSHWLPYLVLATMLLRVALAFVVLSMAKERDEAEQRRYALTDSLTGLPNRRALFEVAESVVQRRVHGGGTPVSLLIADLDFFKETNDTFGHKVGDDVLCLFANIATRSLEVSNVVGRLGGEEFAAILPSVDGVIAVEEAERLRKEFEQAAGFVNGLPVGATVSIGIASDSEVDSGLSSLFRRADAALYAAKSAGRNRVAYMGANGGAEPPEPSGTVRTSPTRLEAHRSSLMRYKQTQTM